MGDLVYRPAALEDLDAIYDHIEADNPHRALGFVQDIRRRCQMLRAHPRLGPARDDLGPGVRIYVLPRRIVVAYRIVDGGIVVTRVFYGGRDYEALLRDDDPPTEPETD